MFITAFCLCSCKQSGPHRHLFGASFVAKLRGGSSAAAVNEDETAEVGSAVGGPRDIKVLVSTTKISSYVDAVSAVLSKYCPRGYLVHALDPYCADSSSRQSMTRVRTIMSRAIVRRTKLAYRDPC